MRQEIIDRFNRFFEFVYADYEQWIAVPIILLIAAAGLLGFTYMTTGEFISKGIQFTGGTEIQVQVTGDTGTDDVRQALSGTIQEMNLRTISGDAGSQWVIVETTESLESGTIEAALADSSLQYTDEVSIQSIGAAVSSSFLREAQIATLVAFLIMSAVIFVAFRSFVPSMAVILAAFTDIIVSVAGMNLLGIDLTLGSLAALLMLIGYSVDTDIVLSTRLLKQSSTDLKERVRDSITTGLTMTSGALVGFTVLFILSSSATLDQIAMVILMGLLVDIPATWFGNAIILKMHAEGRI